jgi:Na+-translocating ferredoxin:NAD+ oxidoreductase RnfG subunit
MPKPIHWIVPSALVAVAGPCYAVQYLSFEEAQKACFPKGDHFENVDLKLSPDQIKAIEDSSGESLKSTDQKIWKVTQDHQFLGWFIVDQVIGKHELITYGVGLNADGSIKSIEIMDYRESYGYQIRNADWRQQFVGKKKGDKLKLNDDIRNISGATLSCRHVTEGVKRLLGLYEIVLKQS